MLRPGESQEDWERLYKTWLDKYAPVDDSERDLVFKAFENDWLERRALLQFQLLEERMHEVDPLNWTDEEHKRFERFLRYKTAAERAFTRSLRTLEQQLKPRAVQKPTGEQKGERTSKKESAQGVDGSGASERVMPAEKVVRRPLKQTVVVRVTAGKTETWTHPECAALLRMLKVRGEQDAETLVVREFEFPNGVPAEYVWMTREEVEREAGARFRQTLRLAEWFETLEREAAEADGHMRPGGLVEFTGVKHEV
jgi:hypothetical protein